jgi:hypothetical protein
MSVRSNAAASVTTGPNLLMSNAGNLVLVIRVAKVRRDRYPKFPRFITGGLRMR